MSLKTTSLAVIVVASCLLGGITLLIGIFSASTQNNRETQAEAAINELWSPSPEARVAAKRTLIHLGPKAIEPLMRFLNDLVSNRVARYTSGEQAKEALAYYEGLPANIDTEEKRRAAGQLAMLDINRRLLDDTSEILGHLRAEEAAPLLIEVMVDRDVSDKSEKMTPEMQALVEIGAAAVPMLIRVIETAEQQAASMKFADTPFFTEERKRYYIDLETYKLKVRAIMVLGEIRDARYLPVLERLLATTSNVFLRKHVEAAIEKIQEKTK